jgi:hypothetical protein
LKDIAADFGFSDFGGPEYTARTAGVADTLGGQWIIPAAITRREPRTVMECNP